MVTMLFIAFYIGDRSGNSANSLLETLKARLHGAPGLVTTDGLEAYVEKIKRYFRESMYAQVVKEWKGGHWRLRRYKSNLKGRCSSFKYSIISSGRIRV